MKPFNAFVAISLIVILGGFVFLKDGLNNVRSTQSEQAGLLMNIPGYLEYSDESLANAQKKGRPVLFFAATKWCQTCQKLEKEIIERQAEIPEDVTILKVDYDNDKAMNQKHAVTSQYTLVVLESDGREEARWVGGGFDALLQQLGKL